MKIIILISKNIHYALKYFVDNLKYDRHKTIEYFLNEQTIHDIFYCIAQLLFRISGNRTFIIVSITPPPSPVIEAPGSF
jgi:hypothetical protein